jgi:uncharacterized membrane protein
MPSASGGVNKKQGAVLSYLLWWVTGIIFLFVGKDDPDVKFHAAQSIIFFGSITVINVILRIVSGIAYLGILGWLALLVWLFGVVVWIMCLMRANSGGGQRFQIPLVGGFVTPYAEQLANAV